MMEMNQIEGNFVDIRIEKNMIQMDGLVSDVLFYRK